MHAAVDPSAADPTSARAELTGGNDVPDLWSQTRYRLHRFLARRAPASVDVGDLLQEVLVRLHRSRDRLEEIEQIDAWLYRVARNVLIDHISALNARREIPVSGHLDIPDMPGDPADAGAADARSELSSCIRPMLETLPDEQRVAIEVTELGRLTQREAAEQLGFQCPVPKS